METALYIAIALAMGFVFGCNYSNRQKEKPQKVPPLEVDIIINSDNAMRELNALTQRADGIIQRMNFINDMAKTKQN